MARKKPTPDDAPPPDVIEPELFQRANALSIWSNDDTGHLLTVDQALFCRSYIIDRNPVAALRRLNYGETVDKLKRIADKYLENLEVQACIETLAQRMMERLQITAERVNERIAAVAFFDPRTVMEFDHTGVHVKHSRYWTKDEAYALQSVKMTPNGVEMKMHDGVRAAELLAKQLGVQPDDNIGETEAIAESVVKNVFTMFDRMFAPKPALPAPDATTTH